MNEMEVHPVARLFPMLSDAELQELARDIAENGQQTPCVVSESGMRDLIERLTKPGDLVCDPFLGGGTTAVACLSLGRRFVGCDINADAVAAAKNEWKRAHRRDPGTHRMERRIHLAQTSRMGPWCACDRH